MNPTASHEPGARVDGVIPLCVPEIRGNEWKYVKECLDTGWVSSVGSFVGEFERAIAQASGMAHAIALVNGTSALHLALTCAGVQNGDEVLVSALTFIAPANAIRYAGAHPVFVDVEPQFWQMDPSAVERFLTEECVLEGGSLRNRSTGRTVRAIVPVDILGCPVDIDPIADLAERFGLVVVEDATESLGATYKGAPVGKRAGIACFSFNGNKLVTTGGGGAIATDDAEFARRARHFATQAKEDPVEYIHDAVGYNYRLTNVQAAIGLAQMELLDEYVATKRSNAARYARLLDGVRGVSPMREPSYGTSAFWLYTILVNEATFGMSSRALLRYLAERRIQTRPLWQPMTESPAHAGELSVGGQNASRICREALSLPSSVGLSSVELEMVASAICEAGRG